MKTIICIINSAMPVVDPDSLPDPDPHQSDKLDPDQFADDKPMSMEYEPISAFFQGF